MKRKQRGWRPQKPKRIKKPRKRRLYYVIDDLLYVHFDYLGLNAIEFFKLRLPYKEVGLFGDKVVVLVSDIMEFRNRKNRVFSAGIFEKLAEIQEEFKVHMKNRGLKKRRRW